MSYKAFQDWYHEGNIKHLLLYEYNGYLISPPFATERCKEYNKIMKYNGTVSYIDTQLPPATSKTNCVLEVNDSLYFVPYGIYDDYNTILELKDDEVIYHQLESKGKGQFYSGASNSSSGFSFPLGYTDTQYCLHITDKPRLIQFQSVEKAHMGTVYCNGKYYSMPRGDNFGYNNLVSFDGNEFKYYHVPVNSEITRKFTDIIVVGTMLYSLPFGEQSGLTQVVEFNTITEEFNLYQLNVPDFAKKFNSMVLLNNKIIGMPYGDEHCDDSNFGVVFDIETKTSKSFDISITHGGKYRYRSGIAFNNLAVFFPTGTPQCPVFVINEDGSINKTMNYPDYMFGRPVIYKDKVHVLAYHIIEETNHMFIFDNTFNPEIIDV